MNFQSWTMDEYKIWKTVSSSLDGAWRCAAPWLRKRGRERHHWCGTDGGGSSGKLGSREQAMALIGAQGGHGSGSGTSGNLLRLREAWRWQWWPARCPGGAALVGPWWLEEDDFNLNTFSFLASCHSVHLAPVRWKADSIIPLDMGSSMSLAARHSLFPQMNLVFLCLNSALLLLGLVHSKGLMKCLSGSKSCS